MKRLKSIVLSACAVFIGISIIVPTTSVSAVSSSSLSIAPKKNYTIEPGKTVKDKLSIRNLDSTTPLELTLRVIDFTFTDNGGTPKLFLAQDAPQTTWSLKPFLNLPKTVTIPPGQSKSVDMSVTIPANHGAGSYYSAILYSSGAPADGGGNVGLNASGVTLVFTSIPGQVNEELKLQKLGLYDTKAKGDVNGYKFITAQELDSIGYTLKNNGNVTESPVGTITVKDLFGHERKLEDVNPNGSLALIGQTRTFSSCIKLKAQDVDFNGAKSEARTCASPGLWPGYYSIALDLFYGQNGNNTQEITGKASFWYLPLWFIIVFLLVLALAFYFIRKLVLNIRRRLYGGVKFNNKKSFSRRKR